MTSKLLKIVYINHTNHVSGAEISLRTLLTALDRQHFQPFLIIPSGGEWAARCGDLDLPVFAPNKHEDQFFKKPSKRGWPLFIFKFLGLIWQLHKLLNQIDADIIHSNSTRAGLAAVLAVSLTRHHPKVVVHVRDVPDKSQWLQRLTVWCITLLATRLICISNFVAERLEEQLPPFFNCKIKAKITVIYNGMVLNEAESNLPKAVARQQLCEKYNIAVEVGPLFGVIGQITPCKGQLDLLKAFHQLLQADPTRWQKARLLIVGDAKFTDASARYNTQAYKQQLKNFVATHNLEDKVIFTGEQPHILAIMRGLDLVVVPSWHEPFGRVVIEAMSVGTPVLGTASGGIPEIIRHAQSGWLVEPSNPTTTALALQSLFENEVLRQQLADCARLEVAERFEMKKIMGQTEAVYNAVAFNPRLDKNSKSNIKILYVNHTGQVSGAEISLLRALTSLDKSGFKVFLACPADSPLWQAAASIKELQLLNLAAFTFGYRFNFATLRDVFQASQQLSRLVMTIRPNIIHANSIRAGLICGLVRLLVLLRLFRATPRLFVHLRDDMEPTLVNKVIITFLRLLSSKLLAISTYIAQRNQALLRWPGKSNQYVVVHDGVNPVEFDPATLTAETIVDFRNELGLPQTAYPVIGVVGQMTPWKGHTDAIRAMPEILQKFPDARLLVVGSPKFTNKTTRYDTQAYYNELKTLAAELGLAEKVVFTGELKEMPLLMAALDIFLLCSWSEPFGLVFIEAMAMQRPVVATCYGGPEEIVVEGVTGLKVEPRNPQAIAAAVVELASNPNLANKMGQQGRERVLEFFTAEKQAYQLAQLYRV